MPAHTVRQRKNIPDLSQPKVRWFFRYIHRRYLKFALKFMGIAPPDHKEGGWNEGQHTYTDRADAVALMRSKGPGWFIETTPLDDEETLPDDSVTFGDTVFPVGDVIVDNGSKSLPVAISQIRLKNTEEKIESMLEQTSQIILKNRARSA